MNPIAQIIPAEGWEAVILVDSVEGWGTVPLVGWALVHEEENRPGLPAHILTKKASHVVGLVAVGNAVDTVTSIGDSFAGYIDPITNPTDEQKATWKAQSLKLYPPPAPAEPEPTPTADTVKENAVAPEAASTENQDQSSGGTDADAATATANVASN